MNRVDVFRTITSYEAPRIDSSLFQEASRLIEERFSSVPPILEPAYEDFLERFLAETLLYIEKAYRGSPEEQIDLLSFVIQLVLSHTATYQKTLDPIIYAHSKAFLLNSLHPLCKKIVALQPDLTTPYLNRSLLDNLKVQAPLLFNFIINKSDQYAALPLCLKPEQFDKSIDIYERCFSIEGNRGTDSDYTSPQKHLSATYFSWMATVLNIIKNQNPYSINALKGPLLEFSFLFLRSSLLDLYQVKSKDPSNTSPPFILSQKIESLNWNDFFNALKFKSKPPKNGILLPSPLVTRSQKNGSSFTNNFYYRDYLQNDLKFFIYKKRLLLNFCIKTSLHYFFEIMNAKYDTSNRVILFVAQKIDEKNTKVSPIPFSLKDRETLFNLKASLLAFLSLPTPPFLFVELVNLLDWLLQDGFSARHYPFLLHTFHRIMEYSILNILQTCFYSGTGNPSQNIDDYYWALRACVPEILVKQIDDLIMGDALDSFITLSESKGAQEILEAIDLSKIYHTSEEHEQIASKFVTQIEPLIRVLIDLITYLYPYIPQEQLPQPSSEEALIVSPSMLKTIYQGAISLDLAHNSPETTPEKNLAAIYLNWAAALLTVFENPGKHPPYALDGIFDESLDLFLRFSFLHFYKLTKDPYLDSRNLDALPETLKNHRWDDFFTAIGFPNFLIQSFGGALKKTYAFKTRYWVVNGISNRNFVRRKNKKNKSTNKNPSLMFHNYIGAYLFSLPTFDFTTIKSIHIPKNSFNSPIEIAKNIEKEHTQAPSIPFNQEDKETLRNLITSLSLFLSLKKHPFLLPELLHLLYWLREEGFSTRHYPFLLHAFHRIVEYAILDLLQKWFALGIGEPSQNIEDYFPYLRGNLVRPDLADRIDALILKEDLDYFIHPEARTGAKEIMEAVHLSNLELPPEECKRVASKFIAQIKPLLDFLIELIDALNRYKPSPHNPNHERISGIFPHINPITEELK